ncbi:hypothetical protein C1S80_09580 [Mycolicibacterium aubagnense]|nr:hypothetical protein C1S80_09580 [Mycolicibacterium aubagnense]
MNDGKLGTDVDSIGEVWPLPEESLPQWVEKSATIEITMAADAMTDARRQPCVQAVCGRPRY